MEALLLNVPFEDVPDMPHETPTEAPPHVPLAELIGDEDPWDSHEDATSSATMAIDLAIHTHEGEPSSAVSALVDQLAGDNKYARGLVLESLRLMGAAAGDALVVRLTVAPGTWLVAAIEPLPGRATVSAACGCNRCFGLHYCIHLAAVNVFAGAPVFQVLPEWTPQPGRIVLQTLRALHAPGSKAPKPDHQHAPRTLGDAWRRHLPVDIPEAVKYLVKHGDVLKAFPPRTYVVASAHRENVYHAVVDGKCTFHAAGRTVCLCVLAVREFTGEPQASGRAEQPRADSGAAAAPAGPYRGLVRSRGWSANAG